MIFWMMLADVPLIVLIVSLYIKSHSFHLLLIPLPAALVMNMAIYLGCRNRLRSTA